MDHNNFGPDDVSPQSSGADVSGTSSHDAGGMKERARDFAGSAQDRLADVGSSVRERASHMKDSLADALETGADKLRARASSGETGNLAGATGSASVALDDGRMTQMSGQVAGGMEKTADWLRDADLDGLRMGIEQQVKEHPGRTLLIAAGLGYLLGKALRH